MASLAILLAIGMALVSVLPGSSQFLLRPALAKVTTNNVFVDNQVCVQCHPVQASEWAKSHHAFSMNPADEKNVRGNFNDTHFTHRGKTSRFFKKNGKFFVNTEGPDGQWHDYEIRYTFGIEPLQQYLVELDHGRWQALTITWDDRPTEKGGQRWFHLYPAEIIELGDPLHWTGRFNNWNERCAECHSTNLQKNYDLSTGSYQTSWSEINVSCQACHGPGSTHAAWAQSKEKANNPISNKGLLVNYRNTDAHYQVETCARCHSRRHRVSPDDAHGHAFLDDFAPALLREDLYYADGQILDEVYVYGSFLQSKMYQHGVRCTDCHNPHTNRLKREGNALCSYCHQTTLSESYPTLKAKHYDSPEHHFHPAGSTGAQCVNCHMPETTYMVIDPRRDHSFKIPRPDLSIKLGTPNVCTTCHKGKSDHWAAETVAKWYGSSRRPQVLDYGISFTAARAGKPEALKDLVSLFDNNTTPAIVQATALELLPAYFPAHPALAATVKSLKHANALIRMTAVANLERVPLRYRLISGVPLLHDPVRAVRIEAARVLAAIPASQLNPEQDSALNAALKEYKALQQALADTPEAHLNLGVLHTNMAENQKAEAEYLKAIAIAPDFIPARINLANLYNQTNRNTEAEKQFREAISIAPEQGELYYSLGLLLAEQQNLLEAVKVLKQAVKRLPSRVRIAYNLGLVQQKLGKTKAAESTLLGAYQIDATNIDIIYALMTLYTNQSQWKKALPYAREMVILVPKSPIAQRWLRQIEMMNAKK